MGTRKKGKTYVSMWLDSDLVKKLENKADQQDQPRSLVIENVLREELGLPKLDAPSPTTPVKYVTRHKKTIKDVRKDMKS